MTNQTKQTAANNDLLRATKKLMNHKVFKAASRTLNASGEAAVIAYLQRYFRNEISATRLTEMAAEFTGTK